MIAAIYLSDITNAQNAVIRSKVWKRITKILEILRVISKRRGRFLIQGKCTKCGKASLRRLIGVGSGVIFKGSGFYQTDYRSESFKEPQKTKKANSIRILKRTNLLPKARNQNPAIKPILTQRRKRNQRKIVIGFPLMGSLLARFSHNPAPGERSLQVVLHC